MTKRLVTGFLALTLTLGACGKEEPRDVSKLLGYTAEICGGGSADQVAATVDAKSTAPKDIAGSWAAKYGEPESPEYETLYAACYSAILSRKGLTQEP